jgi:hydroxyethylthiazole kinase-like uncharacterized protein yjeF
LIHVHIHYLTVKFGAIDRVCRHAPTAHVGYTTDEQRKTPAASGAVEMDEVFAGEALLFPEEMGEADRLTIAGGVAGYRLMESAGYAVADVVCRRFSQGTRVVVVCGAGNNGGDGFVVARVLRARGFIVEVALAFPEGKARSDLKGDARKAADAWTGEVRSVGDADFDRAAVVVDALFGAGLARDVGGADAATVAAIAAARKHGARVYAIDLPSGIDGGSGEIRGVAVSADETVTFFRRKPGHLLLPGRTAAGKVHVADIGIAPSVLGAIAPKTRANGPDLWRAVWPSVAADAHKFSRGAALIASGPAHATGAIRLASEAALRAGAGIVTIASPPDAVLALAAGRAAPVIRPVENPAALPALFDEPRLRAGLIGPGFGLTDANAAAIAGVLEKPVALVLDADALTLIARDPVGAFAAIKGRGGAVVLTPHEGEFARLFPDLAGSKLRKAREAAARSGAVVLVKGPDTVIAHPDGRAAINENGTAALATAGSGDVLAGLITGLMAAGVPAFEAASLGAWMHGEAGRRAGYGSIADDIAAEIRPVIAAGCPEPEAEDEHVADLDALT